LGNDGVIAVISKLHSLVDLKLIMRCRLLEIDAQS